MLKILICVYSPTQLSHLSVLNLSASGVFLLSTINLDTDVTFSKAYTIYPQKETNTVFPRK